MTKFEIKKGGTLPYHLSGVTPQSTPFPITDRLFILSNFGLSTQARALYRCHTRIPFHFKIRAQKSPLGLLLRVPNGLFDFFKKKKINLATTYSHIAFRYTTIGATVFHFRVRNGTGWCHCAMATRSLLRDKFRNRILATDHSIKNGFNVSLVFS